MEQAIEQIKLALINSLSMNEQLRNQAMDFLTNQCEPNPEFQQALFHIITEHSAASMTPDQKQLQYQAILCMKNSLTRILCTKNRKVFKVNQSQALSEQSKDSIKA